MPLGLLPLYPVKTELRHTRAPNSKALCGLPPEIRHRMSINPPTVPGDDSRQRPEPLRPDLRIVESDDQRHRPPVQSLPGSSWARRYRSYLRTTDFAIIVLSVLSSSLADVPLAAETPAFQDPVFWLNSFLLILVWSALLGIYHTRDPRVVGVGVTEYMGVVHATTLVFVLMAIGFAMLGVGIPRGHFMVAFPLGIIGLTLSRWLWRKWLT